MTGSMSVVGTFRQVRTSLSNLRRPKIVATKSVLAEPFQSWYICTIVPTSDRLLIERVQTGVRMEKRLLKVLKAFAEYHDLTLGDLLEGIVLHAFDGKCPFSEESRRRIKELKTFYGLDLDSSASHRLKEVSHSPSPKRGKNK